MTGRNIIYYNVSDYICQQRKKREKKGEKRVGLGILLWPLLLHTCVLLSRQKSDQVEQESNFIGTPGTVPGKWG